MDSGLQIKFVLGTMLLMTSMALYKAQSKDTAEVLRALAECFKSLPVATA